MQKNSADNTVNFVRGLSANMGYSDLQKMKSGDKFK